MTAALGVILGKRNYLGCKTIRILQKRLDTKDQKVLCTVSVRALSQSAATHLQPSSRSSPGSWWGWSLNTASRSCPSSCWWACPVSWRALQMTGRPQSCPHSQCCQPLSGTRNKGTKVSLKLSFLLCGAAESTQGGRLLQRVKLSGICRACTWRQESFHQLWFQLWWPPQQTSNQIIKMSLVQIFSFDSRSFT